MSNRPASFEDQATACLKAAETHRAPLMRFAVSLMGNDEAGRDLFSHVVLLAHDTIQSKGFTGDDFHLYMFRILKNEAAKLRPSSKKHVELSEKMMRELMDEESPVDMRAHFAEQVAKELESQYAPAEVALMKLHAEGYSYRDIAAITNGGDFSWIRRKVERMKAQLRETFSVQF